MDVAHECDYMDKGDMERFTADLFHKNLLDKDSLHIVRELAKTGSNRCNTARPCIGCGFLESYARVNRTQCQAVSQTTREHVLRVFATVTDCQPFYGCRSNALNANAWAAHRCTAKTLDMSPGQQHQVLSCRHHVLVEKYGTVFSRAQTPKLAGVTPTASTPHSTSSSGGPWCTDGQWLSAAMASGPCI